MHYINQKMSSVQNGNIYTTQKPIKHGRDIAKERCLKFINEKPSKNEIQQNSGSLNEARKIKIEADFSIKTDPREQLHFYILLIL